MNLFRKTVHLNFTLLRLRLLYGDELQSFVYSIAQKFYLKIARLNFPWTKTGVAIVSVYLCTDAYSSVRTALFIKVSLSNHHKVLSLELLLLLPTGRPFYPNMQMLFLPIVG